MPTPIENYLESLPKELHSNFFKLVEYWFWDFQYACRHFQMHFKRSQGKIRWETEIRDHPAFKILYKQAKESIKRNKELGNKREIENIIDNIRQIYKQTNTYCPDIIFEAVKRVLIEGKPPPRKKIKKDLTSDDIMDLIPTVLEKLAIHECGINEDIFNKMVSGQLTSEEWAHNESVKQFCAVIENRMICAEWLERLAASIISMGEKPHPTQTMGSISWDKKLTDQDEAINRFLLRASNEYGAGYYLHDLFRQSDIGSLFPNSDSKEIIPLDVVDYPEKFRSLLQSGIFWQPATYRTALDWILFHVTSQELAPYISVYSNVIERYPVNEFSHDQPLAKGKSDEGQTISIFVKVSYKTVTIKQLVKTIGTVERLIVDKQYEIKREKKVRNRNIKAGMDVQIYSDELFEVILNSSMTEFVYDQTCSFCVMAIVDHSDFAAKKVFDLLRFLYFAHAYIQNGEQLIGLLNDKMIIVSDFKFATISRAIGLWMWDKVHAKGMSLSAVIQERHQLIVAEGGSYRDEYLKRAYSTTLKCIEDIKIYPISDKPLHQYKK